MSVETERKAKKNAKVSPIGLLLPSPPSFLRSLATHHNRAIPRSFLIPRLRVDSIPVVVVRSESISGVGHIVADRRRCHRAKIPESTGLILSVGEDVTTVA